MNRSLIALFAIAALVACDDGGPATPTPPAVEVPNPPERPDPRPPVEPPEEPEIPIETPDEPEPPEAERPAPARVDIGHGAGGRVEIAPPTPTKYPTSRARRRMNIDQLDAAFRRVSGGIGWTEMRGQIEVNLFEDLAATLGKPDYIQITTESLEPSALFQKFLDDAARKVCAAVVERDRATPAAAVLIPQADIDPDVHLRHLLLRWHGRDVPLDSPDLMHWRWLYDSVSFVTGDDDAAWHAVCATLYTHPDFYSY